MKLMKVLCSVFAVLLALVGIATAAFGIHLSFRSIGAAPVLVEQPEAVLTQLSAMMDAVCAGDFTTAGNLMQGTPNLGVDRAASEEVGVLVWDAFVDSFSYEVVGQCYATDSGVAQDIRITCMELDSVTAVLRERSQRLLEQRVEEAEKQSDIYDENNNYREDVVMEVLYDATKEALEQDAKTVTFEVTVNLVHNNGQWWIVPEDALLTAISGGILK